MLLDRQTYFVRERVGFAKLTDAFDILDPASQATLGVAKEEPPGWAKWLRLLVNKQFLPTSVHVYEGTATEPLLSIHRSATFLRAKIRVTEAGGKEMGYFKSKLFSFGGGFYVFDPADQQVAEVKGDWKGWDFQFLGKDGRLLGKVPKKWAGIGRQFFTSADNYVISLADESVANPAVATLLLAAGLSIDIVFKER